MLYYDMFNFITYIQNLPRDTQETIVMIVQIAFIIVEVCYFFYLRKYFKEEEKRIMYHYKQSI